MSWIEKERLLKSCRIDSARFSALKCDTINYFSTLTVSSEKTFLPSYKFDFRLFNKWAYSCELGIMIDANSQYLKNPSLSLSKCLNSKLTSSLGGMMLSSTSTFSNLFSDISPVLISNILKASSKVKSDRRDSCFFKSSMFLSKSI